jgi:hypothetical protein
MLGLGHLTVGNVSGWTSIESYDRSVQLTSTVCADYDAQCRPGQEIGR